METYIVAAFAAEQFRGNPAGVCVVDNDLDPSVMQCIAGELRQPETVFLRKRDETWEIRWFSPVTEVALCGHATLAAAKVLWERGLAEPELPLKFVSKSSTLTARLADDGMVWLTFPAMRGTIAIPDSKLLSCIDVQPIASSIYDDRWLLEFDSSAAVRSLKPDFIALKNTGIRSLIVTSLSDMPDYDIVS